MTEQQALPVDAQEPTSDEVRAAAVVIASTMFKSRSGGWEQQSAEVHEIYIGRAMDVARRALLAAREA